ncbi:3-dehydroquinate synthase [Chryseolinea lacunae]|uniref:3-dehydroquinate synthase n=1 Tax=Chryseolinea lacunae TaxID=2801331 RepID=A0ABS1KVI7_9BACT|nr:3-dehydroquinate synthase [Chryseolinea lacunae]MBL0743247.1 3-dehydroquinate synthase [Chryseolinea lacunae]
MLPDNILFSHDPANDLATFLQKKKYSQVGVLVDENTRRHSYPLVKDGLPEHFVIEVPSGEEAKNLTTCTTIWQAMTDTAMDRHACLIVLGGGVLGDMGGFCAATYKRGIDFILIPTTLLAQADASIGGKLGVDFNHYKNHIGVFQNPTVTLLYSGFLKTLPLAELRSGFAEVIKHTLIADKAMWEVISQKDLASQDWDALIHHSVAFKARVTQEDPKEKGLRKILNAGHTIGHALETYLLTAGNRILHGEAVAVGLIAEAYIGRQRSMISAEDFASLCTFILGIYGKVNLREEDLDAVAKLALQDKKNKGNSILSVLPDGIGNARWDFEISLEEVKGALSFYRTLHT